MVASGPMLHCEQSHTVLVKLGQVMAHKDDCYLADCNPDGHYHWHYLPFAILSLAAALRLTR